MSALSAALSVDNPVPQLPPGASSPSACNPVLLDVAKNTNKFKTPSDKLVLVLVGLPARGKTFVARKVYRYLEFFHAVNVKIFNIGASSARRAFARSFVRSFGCGAARRGAGASSHA